MAVPWAAPPSFAVVVLCPRLCPCRRRDSPHFLVWHRMFFLRCVPRAFKASQFPQPWNHISNVFFKISVLWYLFNANSESFVDWFGNSCPSKNRFDLWFILILFNEQTNAQAKNLSRLKFTPNGICVAQKKYAKGNPWQVVMLMSQTNFIVPKFPAYWLRYLWLNFFGEKNLSCFYIYLCVFACLYLYI